MAYVRRIKDNITGLAQPARFLELADRVLPGLSIVTTLCFAVGLYLSFMSDGDYQQGETVRIMYVHVPAAWMAKKMTDAGFLDVLPLKGGIDAWRDAGRAVTMLQAQAEDNAQAGSHSAPRAA